MNKNILPNKQQIVQCADYLQRRVMRLLLLYDKTLFQKQFHKLYGSHTHPDIPLLQFYDRYLRLILHSDELLNDLIPRILRQLHHQTSHVHLQEDAPTRGLIDWPRTLQKSTQDLPGQAPVHFETTLQQQSITTPENMLLGTIVVEYEQLTQQVLHEESRLEVLTNAERQQVIQIGERIEQVLKNPFIQAVIKEVGETDREQLTKQMSTTNRTVGRAYQELLTWWEQDQQMRVGTSPGPRRESLMQRHTTTEAERDLYELWFALELAHFLQRDTHCQLENASVTLHHLRYDFVFAGKALVFHYRRQRHVDDISDWSGIHTTITPLTFERAEPLTIRHHTQVIWQEPPFPIRVAYNTVEPVETIHIQTVTRLLGEMRLLGADTGCVLSPFFAYTHPEKTFIGQIQPTTTKYVIATDSRITIREYSLNPDSKDEQLAHAMHEFLTDLLTYLPERQPPACHGTWLDPDNINASRDRPSQGNILCPKPHIGAKVYDLVHHNVHCMQDPRVCHVLGQLIIPPFAVRMATLDTLAQAGERLRKQNNNAIREAEEAGNETYVETLRTNIFQAVGRTVEEYVKVHGNTDVQERQFAEWIFGLHWKNSTRALSAEARNMLLSAAYTWDEYQRANLQDWAAPAIQYCRALETEIQRRLFLFYPNGRSGGFLFPNNQMTLGALAAILRYKDANSSAASSRHEQERMRNTQHNWQLLKNIVHHAGCDLAAFENVLQRLSTERVVVYRNSIAHGDPFPPLQAHSLRDSIVGNRDKPGILCWLVENLDPKP